VRGGRDEAGLGPVDGLELLDDVFLALVKPRVFEPAPDVPG